ncbi:hypothetical protein DDB_G0276915 [Dictyostelium discoideum AX4]|uniref:Uncharacterized protein n=1 Tax=Dictyostelium discoideum TaxID=44689 RepID=Q86JA2_DICDI|nr:hypothetical protein DDB_G0276915 [Dictyostelium discoideum AX4]EAL68959.1 hypothetical protein DDB_G0276915 [Dictyostelium discoideum AX4]|eukprot:XP_642831.1 hypothetical protein DDB_G0276915 [Dictyostelium discoideum AX4]
MVYVKIVSKFIKKGGDRLLIRLIKFVAEILAMQILLVCKPVFIESVLPTFVMRLIVLFDISELQYPNFGSSLID